MDNTTIGKGPSSVGVHQYLPHLVHKVGYSGLQATSGSKIPWLPAQIHPNKNGVSRHLVTGSHLLLCCQN